ncbi:hypothetical protein GOODEAATRI_020365 [Goodea atripinnis]|uniref:Uncharacterized protein n=1 Tax=Goodea atripinnis TaxID=208336 RepID=A0ABV0MTQ7_9TELE
MEGSYQRGQADDPQHHVFGGGIQHPAIEQPNRTAPPWIPPAANFPVPLPGGASFGGSPYPLSYGFDPSVPPPPFSCPPPGHFPGMAPPATGNVFRCPGVLAFEGPPHQLRAAPPRADCGLRQREDYRDGGLSKGGSACTPQPHPPDWDSSWETVTQPEDEEVLQRRQDRQWLTLFLQSGGRTASSPQQQRPNLASVPAFRATLYGAARLVSRLQELCHTLQHKLHSDSGWSESYRMASHVKRELEAEVIQLTDYQSIATELQCEEAFSSQLEQLRSVMKIRTELYSAEEKALKVMLEGEQQEERRREQERRVKKERERQLERKRMVDSMLFGGNTVRFLPGLLCIFIGLIASLVCFCR